MRRKIFQDFANTLCHMLVGWRMTEDFEKIAELPDGTLTIDCLMGTASHDIAGSLSVSVAGELQAWLKQRLQDVSISEHILSEAVVSAKIRTDRIATNKRRIVSFDCDVDSRIATDERTYFGHLAQTHKWHTRTAAS